MECSHLEASVDVSPAFVRKLTSENKTSWTCSVCRTNRSPWICLKCGVVNCGRYINAHAKTHSEGSDGHFVCMDASLMVFCYKCDEFVINDTKTGDVQLVRDTLEEAAAQCSKGKKKRKMSIDPEDPPKKNKNDENGYLNGRMPSRYTPGLRNLGNTCFMNAVLQSLSNLKHFSCYFKEIPAIELSEKQDEMVAKKYYTRSYKPEDVSLVEELRKILCALWQGSSATISPDELFAVVWKVVPRFRGYQQHDAHEFMHYLLDRVHTELLQSNKFSNGKDTIVTSIFGGNLQSEVTCLQCKHLSRKQEVYLDMSLDIPYRYHTHSHGHSHKSKHSKPCYLTDCLQRFVDVEELGDTERYMCPKCNKRQPSTKKFWLTSLSNVLCLHLKRFRYSQFGRSKVDTYVKFPLQDLNMNPYALRQSQRQKENRPSAKSNIYDLAAVVVHHGGGLTSGHYTAYAWHEGSWYHFNDSCVSLVSEEAVARCKAYILFYTRRHPETAVVEKIKGKLTS
ncbi:ubiquitin carboxyl-terminal hydrolase 3-like [Rhopilema esculentum]|uniref:ubiquitin carboxyl-terminal hydrolase 3-like n=1 Tax=Rhopilema esculentum TaxID=499914 RepID=UPI0031D3493B